MPDKDEASPGLAYSNGLLNTGKQKPPMCKKGKTLFLTIAYPPNPTAAAVVHRHLLDQFDPESFVVISAYFPGARKAEVPKEVRCYFIYISFEFLSSKVHRFLAKIQRFTIPLFLNFHISRIKPAKIIIAYPDLYWLDLCSAAAIKNNIPFIPYLHDTLVEGVYHQEAKELAGRVQQRIFNHAQKIAVMSEGMKELYRTKYGLDTIAWEHIYPESPVSLNIQKENRAHWSGDVYEINYRAVQRFNSVLKDMGMQFSISNGKTVEQLKALGITGKHVRKVFYAKRIDYLVQLSACKILLLGLNYADECTVDEDELATIFSTKTPEYLGSGSLIVYNGPAHYFLARFLKEHDCGIIIDTKDENELMQQLKAVIDNYDQYHHKIEMAAASLSVFNAGLVSRKVINTTDV